MLQGLDFVSAVPVEAVSVVRLLSGDVGLSDGSPALRLPEAPAISARLAQPCHLSAGYTR